MELFKRFITYKNLQQYTNALKEWLKKKKAANISSNEQGFTTGSQVYDYVQSNKGDANVIESISINGTAQTITNKNVDITVPPIFDTWDFRVTYNPSAPSVTFKQVKKNGELYTGQVSAYVIKVTDNASVNMMSVVARANCSNGTFTVNISSGSGSQLEFMQEADTLVFKLGSADGAGVYAASYTLPVKASSIVDGAHGFVTGDQVYDYVTSATSVVGAMHFKGSVTSENDLPVSPVSGDVYISTGTFTHNNEAIEPGDIFIYTNVGWAVVQANIDTTLIPTKMSDLTNDTDYISLEDIETVSDSDINNLF